MGMECLRGWEARAERMARPSSPAPRTRTEEGVEWGIVLDWLRGRMGCKGREKKPSEDGEEMRGVEYL